MRQDATDQARGISLFRKNATRSAGHRLFGSVTVVVPPSGYVTLAVGVSALLMLGFVAWYVEIPQRVRAVGVLMPPGGLLDVVASAPGRVARINVDEGQTVNAGDLLLNITTDQQQLVLLQLQSLRAESTLLVEAQARQMALDDNRSLALDERLESIRGQLDIAQRENALHGHQVELLERRAVHRAVGWSVTLKWSTRRRLWDRTRKPNSTWNRAVGTVKKSIETSSPMWLSRKLRQVCDGGFRVLGM